MPKTDGLCAIGEIRWRSRQLAWLRTTIYALTANAMADQTQASAAIDDPSTKPPTADAFFRTVETARRRPSLPLALDLAMNAG